MTTRQWEGLALLLPLLYFPLLYWFGVTHLSIAPFELRELEETPLLSPLSHWLQTHPVSNPEPLLRGVPTLLTTLSTLLLYRLTGHYFPSPRERFYTLLLFLLLPGTILSTILVTKASLLLLETLLLLNLFHWRPGVALLSLPLFTLLDPANLPLGLGALLYGVWHRDWRWVAVGVVGIGEVFLLLHYRIGGVPTGHFLHFLLVYSGIYSPLLFLYFLYTLYKEALPGYRRLVGAIGIGAFTLSLLLSFRQRIKIEEFAPFTLPVVVPIVHHFLNSYRVRLKPFRRGYRLLLTGVLISVVGFDGVLLLNPLKYKLGSGLYFPKPVAQLLPTLLQNRHLSSPTNPYLSRALTLYYHPTGPGECEVRWNRGEGVLEFNCSGELKRVKLDRYLR